MRYFIILLVVFFLGNTHLNSQNRLHDILDSSKISQKFNSLGYVDENGNVYHYRYFVSVFFKVVFTNVVYVKERDVFLIQGRAIADVVPDDPNDTIGISNVTFMLGCEINDTIKNVRFLSKTILDNETPELPRGYFSFETKIETGDKLFIYSYNREGVKVYQLDKLNEAKSRY